MNKKNMPEIRFSGFDDEWKKYIIDNLGNSNSGSGLERYFSKFGTHKIINIGSYGIDNNYIDQGLRINLNSETKNNLLNKEDLAMVLNDKTQEGNIIGRNLYIDEDNKYIFNQRTQRIIVNKEKFNPVFVHQLLNCDLNRNKLVNAAQGNTQIYLNWSTVKNIDLYSASKLAEQEKIGVLFKNIDDLINKTEKQYKYFKNVKETLLNKMFPDGRYETPEIRFKGFNNKWKNSILKNIINIERGASPRPIDKFITRSLGGYNWIKISDAPSDGIYIDKTSEKIIKEGLSKTKVVNKGDLILSNSMSYGRPHIVNLLGCIHDGWLLIKDYEKYLNNLFFCYFLGSENMLKKYKSLAAGSTVNNLNKELVLNCNIDHPELNEQTKIGTFLKNLDDLIELIKQKHEKLKNIKNALLDKMFC